MQLFCNLAPPNFKLSCFRRTVLSWLQARGATELSCLVPANDPPKTPTSRPKNTPERTSSASVEQTRPSEGSGRRRRRWAESPSAEATVRLGASLCKVEIERPCRSRAVCDCSFFVDADPSRCSNVNTLRSTQT